MRLAILADLHGHLPDVPPCDVLLVGGDVRPGAATETDAEVAFLDGPFRAWLEAVPAGHVVGIAGNHDFVFDRHPELVPRDLPWTYLEDTATTVAGLTIWGSPWTPWFFDWAFNAPKEDGEDYLAGLYRAVPEATDVVLVHGPPAGYGDTTARGRRVGSSALLDLVDRVQPRLCAFGHIHEGRGAWDRGATRLVNAAAVDLEYALVADPVVVVDL
jgi:predicted phosphohydrolase